ncbi:MAG: hypothetical protein HY270_20420 [Deltaproteobacteria bacterium]|nr:hypothetical protein [Deltaproteobacteria bacterium]
MSLVSGTRGLFVGANGMMIRITGESVGVAGKLVVGRANPSRPLVVRTVSAV